MGEANTHKHIFIIRDAATLRNICCPTIVISGNVDNSGGVSWSFKADVLQWRASSLFLIMRITHYLDTVSQTKLLDMSRQGRVGRGPRSGPVASLQHVVMNVENILKAPEWPQKEYFSFDPCGSHALLIHGRTYKWQNTWRPLPFTHQMSQGSLPPLGILCFWLSLGL